MKRLRAIACALVLGLCGWAYPLSQERAPVQPLGPMRMAVTVDDLPAHGEMLPGVSRNDIARGVLRALKNNGVKQAYAFANGTDIGDEPELIDVLKTWLKAGYPVGNHTYSHPNLNHLTAPAYIGDIKAMDRLLQTLAPVSPLVERRHVFRYPFLEEGATLEKRDAVRTYLADNHYRIAQVTIDYTDWAWNDAYTRCMTRRDEQSIGWLKGHIVEEAERNVRVSKTLAQLLFGRDIAHILLIHAGAFDAVMLDTILKGFRAKGVTFVTLDEALTDPVYQIDPKHLFDGGRGFLEQIVEARHVDTEGVLRDSPYTVARLGEVCKQQTVQSLKK
jgi:peptidoglycan/xylan/chitin deacetylase (PgdA/CDA1 family)